MKSSRTFLVAAGLALASVVACGLAVGNVSEGLSDRLRLVLIPGALADVFLSANVHQGFGGAFGTVVTVAGSAIVWTVPLWLIIHFVCLPFAKKDDKPA